MIQQRGPYRGTNTAFDQKGPPMAVLVSTPANSDAGTNPAAGADRPHEIGSESRQPVHMDPSKRRAGTARQS